MRAWRNGYAIGDVPARPGRRPAGGVDHGSVPSRGLRYAASAGRKRTLRYGLVLNGVDEGLCQRASRSPAGQQSAVLAHGDSFVGVPNTNARDGNLMNIDFPFQVDGRGRTSVSGDHHLRDLMEQLLFTSPGERVNRPTFGSGLLQMVFAPSSDELAAATQFLLQGTLQQYLGDLIQAEAVRVEIQDSTLLVTVQFVVRATQVRQVAQFSKGI